MSKLLKKFARRLFNICLRLQVGHWSAFTAQNEDVDLHNVNVWSRNTIRLRFMSGATAVAPGVEQGDTARFPQC